jgi:lysine 2,3-aminomutase
MERYLAASVSMQTAIEPAGATDESPSDQNEEPPSPLYKSKMPPVLARLWADVTKDQWNDWRWQFKNRLRSLKELSSLLGLKSKGLDRFKRLFDTYRFSATPYWLSLINWDDPLDPIFRQCIPDMAEIEYCETGAGTNMPGINMEDPLEEEEDSQVPGLVHRYPDRVLAVVTNLCSMYCRHCTRKRAWHEPEAERSYQGLQRMIDYVAATPKVREVIVSGGDPLTMNMDKLDWFLGALESIPHVEVLRIGTRIPVVLPMRITDELCAMLGRHRPLWLNTQFNHPNEVTPEAALACDRLLKVGIPVSNQTVLLRGINDSPEVMKALCHALQRIMVRPYYLFECDPVRGAEHFRTSIWTGVNIIESLRGHTGGLCIPTFVVDATGGGGKIPLQPFYLLSANDEEVVFRNYEGLIIRYPNPHPENGATKKQTAPSQPPANGGERYRRRRLKAQKGDVTCT